MRLKVGDAAPLFELPDQNGKTHKLADYRGRKVLIYFYPKDGTPGCTTEACQIRDNFPKFEETLVTVLGTVRTSFLIDEAGKIIKIYENVKPAIHAEEVLRDLKV